MKQQELQELSATWSEACDRLTPLLGDGVVDGYLRNAELISFQAGQVCLSVPSSFFISGIKAHQSHILKILSASSLVVSSDEASLAQRQPTQLSDSSLSTDQQQVQSQPTAPETEQSTTPEFPAPILRDKYTFEQFVVGPCNKFAHAAALSTGLEAGQGFSPLFLHGSVGIGKTHIAQAIAHKLLEEDPSLRVACLSCEQFINHFIEAIRSRNLESFHRRYRHADVLIVDDIHLLSNKERTQDEFFNTFNVLHQLDKKIVLTSDSTPEAIKGLSNRLKSRFQSGLVAQIEPPCLETRYAILRHKALSQGLELSDDVLHLLCELAKNNIRELEGALNRVKMQALIENRPIDLDLTKRALQDKLQRVERPISMEDIVKVITSYYQVKLVDLQSKSRKSSIMLPRQLCMYFARNITQMGLVEIGHYFGGRDHSTVSNALKKIRKRSQIETEFTQTLSTLEQQIRQR